MSVENIPYAIPTTDASGARYTAIGWVRQNPWKTNTFNPNITLHAKKLHIPFAYGPAITQENAPEQSQYALSLKIGDIVICAYASCALLVRITSEVKRGVMEPILMALNPVEHYQNPTEYGAGIGGFFLKTPYQTHGMEVDGVADALENNYIIEPFFGLYRDIEILGEIVDVEDWRKIVGMASSGKRTIHFRTRPRERAQRSLTFTYTPGGGWDLTQGHEAPMG